MRLLLSAPNLSLTWTRDAQDRPIPASTTPATLLLELPDPEFRSLLLSAATEFTKDHGLSIESLDPRLTSLSPTSARVDVRATVRKSLLKATATLTATATVDERLTLRVADLQARGEGLLAPLIDALLNRKLAEFNGRTFPLAQNLPPNLRVTQLTLTPGPPVHTLSAQVQVAP